MVLWAHNYHVSNQRYAQGSYLKETFGDDLVVLAFTHGRGSFTAFSRNAGRRDTWELDPPLTDSLGNLDGGGAATTLFTLPGATLGPAWVGTQVHHAYVALDGGLAIQLVSNPVLVTLAP